MNDPLVRYAADPALRSRAQALTPPRTRLGAFGYRLQGLLEDFVARVSLQGDPVVYDNRDFPWVMRLEARWPAIRRELDAVLEDRDGIPNFQDILEEVRTIQQDSNWKTFFLALPGMDCRRNAAHCPATMAALREVPGLRTAFFSILEPGKHIPPHRGAYNGVLRLHLALQVPEPASRCSIRVGDRICHWREGEALIFDDSFNHQVWNDTAGTRVVLFLDFARPLRQPWHWLNERFLDLAALTPFMRRAAKRQRQWLSARASALR
jgi:aspartyl/asparaginyl beta-hydroxylase (cupin superfamily)